MVFDTRELGVGFVLTSVPCWLSAVAARGGTEVSIASVEGISEVIEDCASSWIVGGSEELGVGFGLAGVASWLSAVVAEGSFAGVGNG